jgi:hypothetical protein
MYLLRLASFVFLLTSTMAFADAPMPPPALVITCSLSRSVCAESDPASRITRVVRQSDGALLWSIPGWHRWLLVSDDGRSMAICNDLMNLVPRNADMSREVMHFYSQGIPVHTLRLADLLEDLSQLQRTASHLAWAESISVNSADQLVLRLVTGKTVMFSMNTGQRVPAALTETSR